MSVSVHTVNEHFTNRHETVNEIYEAVLRTAKRFGPVTEEAKKTSIHLVRKSAFAGIATRKTYLILTLKSDSDLKSPRVTKHEQASSNRWHLEIKLTSSKEVDKELIAWLKRAYDLSG